MKIKHTLYIVLLVFSLFPLYIFGAFMIYENNRKVESIMRENLELISGTQILSIKSFCDTKRERLEMISQYSIVQDAILVSLGEREEKGLFSSRDYLANMLTQRKRYDEHTASVSVVDRNFKVVASSEEYTKAEESAMKNAPEKYLRGEFQISNVYDRETEEGKKHVVAAYQGVFAGEELIGYVVEEIETDYFDVYRSADSIWQDGTLYILDGEENLVTAGSPGEHSRKEFVTSEEERKSYYKAWNAVDREKNPSGEIRYKIGGIEYITYYSDIDYTDWSIRVTVNLSAASENTAAYRMLLAVTILCISLLLFAVNYLMTKRLMRPIDQISETLKKVQKEQNYTLRIENRKGDELGILAENVNELLNYIEQEDIQEKERQRQLARAAERDPLTGVKNKKAAELLIQDMVQQAAECSRPIAVGFLDIDDFRDYNTNFGHQEGDHVIQFVASILKESVNGAVGRVGGDEFVFCVSGKETARIHETVKTMLRRLNQGMIQKETGKRLSVACSVGVVVDAGAEIHYSSMIRKADEAMYQAKEKGKNTYWFWDGSGAAGVDEDIHA